MLTQHCQVPKRLLHMWGNLKLVQYMWSNEKLDTKNKEHHTAEHFSAPLPFEDIFFGFLQKFHDSSIQKRYSFPQN